VDYSLELNEIKRNDVSMQQVAQPAWKNRDRRSITDPMNGFCGYKSKLDELNEESMKSWADTNGKSNKSHGHFGKSVRRATVILGDLIRESPLGIGRHGHGGSGSRDGRGGSEGGEHRCLRENSVGSGTSNEDDSSKSCDQSNDSLTAKRSVQTGTPLLLF